VGRRERAKQSDRPGRSGWLVSPLRLGWGLQLQLLGEGEGAACVAKKAKAHSTARACGARCAVLRPVRYVAGAARDRKISCELEHAVGGARCEVSAWARQRREDAWNNFNVPAGAVPAQLGSTAWCGCSMAAGVGNVVREAVQ
jgi:hypothetical protein